MHGGELVCFKHIRICFKSLKVVIAFMSHIISVDLLPDRLKSDHILLRSAL